MMKTGDEYFDSEEFQQMLTTYEKAIRTGEPVFLDADELAEIADYYQMNQQPDDADQAINMALSLSPGAIMPLTYKIHEALYNNNVEEAERYFEQIIETDDPDYLYDQLEIMLAKGQSRKAQALMNDHLEQLPPNERQDFIVDAANILQEYNYNEEALQWLKQGDAETAPDYKELMARVLFGVGQYADSESIYNELIDTDPFSPIYWNAMSKAQFMQKKFSDSLQSCDYALAITPNDADSLLLKASNLYKLDNMEQASEYFQRYEQTVGDDEFELLHHGTALANMGHYEEGIEKLKRAALLTTSEPYTNDAPSPYVNDIYEELAFSLLEQQRYDEALQQLDETDNIACDHTQMTVLKGHILLAAGRREEAEAAYQLAIVNSAEPTQTFLRVAVSVYDNQYAEMAYRMLKTYFTMVPKDNTEGYAYMTLCCYTLKRNKEFLSYLKEACQRNPEECRMALGFLFPPDVEPSDYYEYFKDQPITQ